MNILDKLQRKIGKYAIPNLMLYISIMYVAGFILNLFAPTFYLFYLSLDMAAVFRGQVWRLITFMIAPPSTSPIFFVFVVMCYYSIGMQLEYQWGTFRFNFYFFSGILAHILAALILYLVFGLSLPIGTNYITLSLFMAFAVEFPDMMFRLYFVIPIKAKWLAIVDAIIYGGIIIGGFLTLFIPLGRYGFNFNIYSAVAASVSLLNFIVFFFLDKRRRFSPKQAVRRASYHAKVKAASSAAGKSRHKCAICGRTELDGDDLEFRYCSKCDGEYEYCQDHLYTHKHVTKGN